LCCVPVILPHSARAVRVHAVATPLPHNADTLVAIMLVPHLGIFFVFLIHRSHSISFTRVQGIPKYKIGNAYGAPCVLPECPQYKLHVILLPPCVRMLPLHAVGMFLQAVLGVIGALSPKVFLGPAATVGSVTEEVLHPKGRELPVVVPLSELHKPEHERVLPPPEVVVDPLDILHICAKATPDAHGIVLAGAGAGAGAGGGGGDSCAKTAAVGVGAGAAVGASAGAGAGVGTTVDAGTPHPISAACWWPDCICSASCRALNSVSAFASWHHPLACFLFLCCDRFPNTDRRRGVSSLSGPQVARESQRPPTGGRIHRLHAAPTRPYHPELVRLETVMGTPLPSAAFLRLSVVCRELDVLLCSLADAGLTANGSATQRATW
jgi:hypothetical protein